MFTRMAPRFILARSSARSVLRERSEKARKTPRASADDEELVLRDSALRALHRSSVKFWLHATTFMPNAFAAGTVRRRGGPRRVGPGSCPARRDGKPRSASHRRGCPVLYAGPFRNGEDEPHAISDGVGRPRGVAAEWAHCGARRSLRCRKARSPARPGPRSRRRSRPGRYKRSAGLGRPSSTAGKRCPLLGDDNDLVVGQLIDDALRRDRLAVNGDRRVVG